MDTHNKWRIIILYLNIGPEYDSYEKIITDTTSTSSNPQRRSSNWRCSEYTLGLYTWRKAFNTFEGAKTACNQNTECRFIELKDCSKPKSWEICSWPIRDGDLDGNGNFVWGESCLVETRGKDEFFNIILWNISD